MPAILFALISFFGWAVGDVFATIATRRIGSYSTALFRMIFGFVIFSAYVPFTLYELKNLTIELLILIIFLSIVGIVGLIGFYEGLKNTNAAIAGTVGNAYPLIAVIISLAFLKETTTIFQIIAILIIFVGLIFSTVKLKDLISGIFSVEHGLRWSLLSMVSFGIYFSFIKIPIKEIGWFWPSYIIMATFPLVFFFMKIRRISFNTSHLKNTLIPLLVLAVFWTVAEFSYNIGVSKSSVAVIIPIAGSAPTLFAVLAFLIFKDPITKQQILGIVTTLIGIVLLSFFSV